MEWHYQYCLSLKLFFSLPRTYTLQRHVVYQALTTCIVVFLSWATVDSISVKNNVTWSKEVLIGWESYKEQPIREQLLLSCILKLVLGCDWIDLHRLHSDVCQTPFTRHASWTKSGGCHVHVKMLDWATSYHHAGYAMHATAYRRKTCSLV